MFTTIPPSLHSQGRRQHRAQPTLSPTLRHPCQDAQSAGGSASQRYAAAGAMVFFTKNKVEGLQWPIRHTGFSPTPHLISLPHPLLFCSKPIHSTSLSFLLFLKHARNSSTLNVTPSAWNVHPPDICTVIPSPHFNMLHNVLANFV